MNKENIKQELKEKWEQFQGLSFPASLEDSDIKADLVELDTHIAGLVSSYLGGAIIDRKLVFLDKKIDEQMNSFIPETEQDKGLYPQYVEYKKKIDELTILLAKCLDIQLD